MSPLCASLLISLGLGSHSTSTDCSAKKSFGETYIVIQSWGGPWRDPLIHALLPDNSSPVGSSLMLSSLSLQPLIQEILFSPSDIFLTLLASSRSHSWPQSHGILWEFTTFPWNTSHIGYSAVLLSFSLDFPTSRYSKTNGRFGDSFLPYTYVWGGIVFPPPNSYVEVLPPSTSECDYILRWGL